MPTQCMYVASFVNIVSDKWEYAIAVVTDQR